MDPQEAAEQSELREHLDYLRRMTDAGVIPKELANKARAVWLVTRVYTGGKLTVPAAAAFTGGPVEYAWEAGPHQLSTEIPADGPCHWFYRHRETGETWGAAVPADEGFPPPLVQYLYRLTSSKA